MVALLAALMGGSVAVSQTVVSAAWSGAAVPLASPAADCAAAVLASLTESQRIGQLFMLGFGDQLDSAERAAIAESHLGSLTYTTRTAAGVLAVHATVDAIQAQATLAATGNVGFLIAANQEGGLIQTLSGPGFEVIPTALSQGKLRPSVLKASAARWGAQLGDAGLNLDFAPVADVVPPGTAAGNAPIGQLKREFGHTPAVVSTHVKAFIAGMRRAGIATTVKHFPGLGRVRGNTDFTAAVTDSVTTRHDAFLTPFATAIDAGVPFVMVSLATYDRIDPAHLAAFSPTIIKGMLRGDLGFRGVVISDDLAAAAVASMSPATRAIEFVRAGGDMITVTRLGLARKMVRALASRASRSPSFHTRIDEAALLVLRAKETLRLLPCGG